MHDIDRGHRCSLCKRYLSCTIEDGFCDGNSTCDGCIKEEYYRREYRNLDYAENNYLSED